jgi:GcrA cell cycle regulator
MLMDGMSFLAIANCVGTTRNAIAGLKWRMVIAVKPTNGEPSSKLIAVKPRRLKPPKPIGPQLPVLAKPTIPSNEPPPPGVATNRISILQLNLNTCRWPIGEPRDADFGYCGDKVFYSSAGKRMTYCLYHSQIAYSPLHCRALGLPLRPEPDVELVA